MDNPMSTKQAAEVLGISVEEVRRRIDTNDLEAVMIGGNWKVRIPPLDEETASNPVVAIAEQIFGLPLSELAPLLEPQQVATMLKIPIRRVRDSMRSGQLPTVQLGTRLYVPTPAFVAMLTTGQTAA